MSSSYFVLEATKVVAILTNRNKNDPGNVVYFRVSNFPSAISMHPKATNKTHLKIFISFNVNIAYTFFFML